MVSKKPFRGRRKRCKHCGEMLDAIWFAALMTEEWRWNGYNYFECSAKHGLLNSFKSNIICPNCEGVVGTGLDFGFGKSYKYKEHLLIISGKK